MAELSHISSKGDAHMVDTSSKPMVQRTAEARGTILLQPSTIALIERDQVAKGNVFAAARLAGIMAAKKTGELIPLCHPLALNWCDVQFEIPSTQDRIHISATTRITAQTGVEMEALTAVAVAALTIFDMCKAVDKQMVISDIRVHSKTKETLTTS